MDDSDLLAVQFAFGRTDCPCPEDLNGDGQVDDADLLMVLFNFGQSAGGVVKLGVCLRYLGQFGSSRLARRGGLSGRL